ncbi:MAG: hypothetical protein JW736_05620, partial [Deltaproteobacteria bacterium]|nr:hypothetical protein [Deltaproteobacteria bacterium]
AAETFPVGLFFDVVQLGELFKKTLEDSYNISYAQDHKKRGRGKGREPMPRWRPADEAVVPVHVIQWSY